MKITKTNQGVELELNNEWHIISMIVISSGLLVFMIGVTALLVAWLISLRDGFEWISALFVLCFTGMMYSLTYFLVPAIIRASLPQTLTIEIQNGCTRLCKTIAYFLSMKKSFGCIKCLTIKPVYNQGFGYYIVADFSDGKKYVLIPPHVESDSASRAKRRGEGVCRKLCEVLEIEVEIKTPRWEKYMRCQ